MEADSASHPTARKPGLTDQSEVTQQLANTSVARTPTPAIPTPLASAKSLEQEPDVKYDNYIYVPVSALGRKRNYQRIREVESVFRRAEDVSALHLSQWSAPFVQSS